MKKRIITAGVVLVLALLSCSDDSTNTTDISENSREKYIGSWCNESGETALEIYRGGSLVNLSIVFINSENGNDTVIGTMVSEDQIVIDSCFATGSMSTTQLSFQNNVNKPAFLNSYSDFHNGISMTGSYYFKYPQFQ